MFSKPTISKKRADRALERQLAYQTEKADRSRDEEDQLVRGTALKSMMFRQRIEPIRPWRDDDRVLEVGSGAHGLVFGFDKGFCIGVDPLAADYRRLFPKVQTLSQTVGAIGEELPFDDAAFDVVISDNVIDHAADPFAIIDELIRVLRPGGLLYFTVNIHHPFYDKASRLYGSLRNIGLPFEVSPFADHTVHLTEESISSVFGELPLDIIQQSSNADGTRASQRASRKLDPDSLLKKMFFKNAIYEVIAYKL